jgi:GTP-binding protein
MAAFVDRVVVHVAAGNGGHGVSSVHREKFKPLGGPDGGNGGDGGDIVLEVDPSVHTLLDFHHRPHQKAGNGQPGEGSNRHGARGEEKVLHVPAGTVVSTPDGRVIADLVGAGTRVVLAKGGKGGLGNAALANSRRKAPGFALLGEEGESFDAVIELKSIADVGLVGFPSAGKSSLIAAMSAARPKIADYPFTTLEPHLGVVRHDDTEFVVADVPGLIEGASEGRGLGHQFLRHVERARVLLVLVDLAAVDERAPEQQERILLEELGRYRPELLDRPRLVVGSKADVAALAWDGPRLSAATGEGVRAVVGRLAELVTRARAEEAAPEAYAVHTPVPEGVRVEREGGGFVVVGREAERAVALSDLTNAGALAYAHDRLRRLGVLKALARAGAQPGDAVRIGSLAFEYEPD